MKEACEHCEDDGKLLVEPVNWALLSSHTFTLMPTVLSALTRGELVLIATAAVTTKHSTMISTLQNLVSEKRNFTTAPPEKYSTQHHLLLYFDKIRKTTTLVRY